VGLKPDVVITHGTPAALALKQSTSTIPIVVAAIGDAVAVGIVDSLARPGGNITGSTFLSLELYAKRIDLLREALPRLRRLAFHGNVNNPSYKTALTEIQRTTAAFKVEVAGFGVGRPEEIDAAFVDMAKRRIEAVSVAEQVFFLNHARLVVAAAQKHRLPLIGGIELAEAGALIGYGTDLIRLYYRTAYFVDKILKVARPRDLPVEQASKFDLVINLKAAKALGIRIPASLVQRADRVID
jgi:putative ABC transport system substrate-binding protein